MYSYYIQIDKHVMLQCLSECESYDFTCFRSKAFWNMYIDVTKHNTLTGTPRSPGAGVAWLNVPYGKACT